MSQQTPKTRRERVPWSEKKSDIFTRNKPARIHKNRAKEREPDTNKKKKKKKKIQQRRKTKSRHSRPTQNQNKHNQTTQFRTKKKKNNKNKNKKKSNPYRQSVYSKHQNHDQKPPKPSAAEHHTGRKGRQTKKTPNVHRRSTCGHERPQ